jgi:hypothetical protein
MCPLGHIAVAEKPEVALAGALRDELGVEVNPQALRIFIRSRWGQVCKLAHAIHEAKGAQS